MTRVELQAACDGHPASKQQPDKVFGDGICIIVYNLLCCVFPWVHICVSSVLHITLFQHYGGKRLHIVCCIL